MDSSRLIDCIDCGKKLSNRATSCPHCGSSTFQGVKCSSCQQIMKRSEAVSLTFQVDISDEFRSVSIYMHPHCLSAVKQTKIKCVLCEETISELKFSDKSYCVESLKNCPNCGHPLNSLFCPCVYCQVDLNPDIETFIQLKRIGGKVIREYAHKVCASARGIDTNNNIFSKLTKLLSTSNWKEADLETELLLRSWCGANEYGINSIPSSLLKIIDQLWVKHSGGKFGFSVQKHFWQQQVTSKFGRDIAFESQIGWKKVDVVEGYEYRVTFEEIKFITYDISARKGHLPTFFRTRPKEYIGYKEWMDFLDKSGI